MLFAASGAATAANIPFAEAIAVAAEVFLGHIGNGAGDGRPGWAIRRQKPITEERRVVPIHCAPSSGCSIPTRFATIGFCPLLVCSSIKSISDTENRRSPRR
ncbi:hypothetical protein KCP77_07780 [Salmonella enterica subsp. enterica]|nr:hypothetical protein KCP77_07780 [Salmonella enterica subsp. enterica]